MGIMEGDYSHGMKRCKFLYHAGGSSLKTAEIDFSRIKDRYQMGKVGQGMVL